MDVEETCCRSRVPLRPNAVFVVAVWCHGLLPFVAATAIAAACHRGRVPSLAVAATCKHFVAYSVETDRQGFDAVVPLRDLHQTYLPPFQRCVQAGRPAQIMCR